MNMPLRTTETVMALPASSAAVVAIPTKQVPFATRLRTHAQNIAVNVIPPVLVIALVLVVWQVLCSKPGASLPPPLKVLDDTWELIIDPFFDRGGLDKGLFWHMSASLQRVALGYALAAIAGVALGTLVGQSTWAMRGLDPIFQVLRTVPPLAWLPLSLAAFRNGQPSAIFVIFITAIWPIIINTAVGIRNIPQDYRNVAQVLRLNHLEFFFKIMVPAAAPYIFTGPAHRHRPVVARHRRGRDADRRRRHRLLHLGCVEFLAHQRNHPGAGLRRPGRLHPRPHRRRRRHHRHPRHRCELRRTAMPYPYLKIDHVDKSFTRGTTETEVLKDITLGIEKGEYVSIIGHSGCGKSTLLNLVAGLLPVSAGCVLLENKEVNDPGPDRAVVFQNHSLLPWLTVYGNVKLAVDKVFGSSQVARRAPRLGHAQPRSGADGPRQGQAAGGDFRRHEAARRPGPRARHGAQGSAARRAVRRARRVDACAPAGLGDGDPQQARQHGA